VGKDNQVAAPALVPADRPSLWAVLPSTLSAIAAVVRSGVRGQAPSAHLEAGPEAVLARRAADGDRATTGTDVAILTLRGLITPRASFLSWLFGGGAGLNNFREAFREALSDSDVGSILIDIDSPGGSTDLLEETAAEIREARGTKPIIAISNTLCASAAYWIAAQADELVVTPSGFAGSIGIYIVHQDWSGFNKGLGVDPTYVSAGRFKTEGNEDEPLDDTAREHLQSVVDDFYDLFVGAVAAGRGVDEDDVRNGFGEGRVLTAQRALEANLVDSIESFEEVVSRLLASSSAQPVSGRATQVQPPPAAATAPPNGAEPEVAAPAPASAEQAPASTTTPPEEREEAPAPEMPPWLLIPTPRH
jgi:signal peptide peptidase SppA